MTQHKTKSKLQNAQSSTRHLTAHIRAWIRGSSYVRLRALLVPDYQFLVSTQRSFDFEQASSLENETYLKPKQGKKSCSEQEVISSQFSCVLPFIAFQFSLHFSVSMQQLHFDGFSIFFNWNFFHRFWLWIDINIILHALSATLNRESAA